MNEALKQKENIMTKEKKLKIIDNEIAKQQAEAHLLEGKGKSFTAKIMSIVGLLNQRDELLFS
jgi:hypothetical protein